jgi:uncharacterized protein (TIGR03435 family)
MNTQFLPGGRVKATGANAFVLLRLAYDVERSQIANAPAWVFDDRFDIEAKSDMNPSPAHSAIVQAILKDRYKLAVHKEKREQPDYALVLARSDRRFGPHLKVNAECEAYFAASHSPSDATPSPKCGANIGRGSFVGSGIAMSRLADNLSIYLGRPTTDRTGLIGSYDIDLRWTPDQLAANPDAPIDLARPTLFTALQEQLGLKLIAEKSVPVDVLVIDKIERPSEN